MKNLISHLNPLERLIAWLQGHLPTRFNINKATRISIYRYRPADLHLVLELLSEGVFMPIAEIHVNGNRGTITTEQGHYMTENAKSRVLNENPGVETRYV